MLCSVSRQSHTHAVVTPRHRTFVGLEAAHVSDDVIQIQIQIQIFIQILRVAVIRVIQQRPLVVCLVVYLFIKRHRSARLLQQPQAPSAR